MIDIPPLSWEREPFNHVVVDGFLSDDLARDVAAEFPAFDAPAWYAYDNPLEIKRTCDSWRAFGSQTYRLISYLNSPDFIENLRATLGLSYRLYQDPGLHGGGLHLHARGGRLNPHLDYAVHRSLGLARKINLILYLNEDWQEEWGGHLGLYSNPKHCEKRILPAFNRAVVFETPNAWHGLAEPVACPEGRYRKSLAVYYLTDLTPETEARSRALFAPTPEQEGDQAIAKLIAQRADESTAASAYRVK